MLQNQDLLNDELYLGLRQPRARGQEYDEFVNKFMKAARKLFPKAYIHLSVLRRIWSSEKSADVSLARISASTMQKDCLMSFDLTWPASTMISKALGV